MKSKRKKSQPPPTSAIPPANSIGTSVDAVNLLSETAKTSITATELAVIAAGLSNGQDLTPEAAAQLADKALLLFQACSSRLNSAAKLSSDTKVGPTPTEEKKKPSKWPKTGAAFLRAHLRGKGSRSAERQEEFIRPILLDIQSAQGIENSPPTPEEIRAVLKKFKATLLDEEDWNYRLYEVDNGMSIPENRERMTERRRKGSLDYIRRKSK